MTESQAYALALLYSGIASYVYLKDKWAWTRTTLGRYFLIIGWVVVMINFTLRAPWNAQDQLAAVAVVMSVCGMSMLAALLFSPVLALVSAETVIGFGNFLMSKTHIQQSMSFDRIDAAAKHGKFKEAFEALDALAEKRRYAGDPDLWTKKAEIHELAGDPEAAVAALRKATALMHDDPERLVATYLRMSDLCAEKLNDPDRARGLLQELVARDPSPQAAKYANARLNALNAKETAE